MIYYLAGLVWGITGIGPAIGAGTIGMWTASAVLAAVLVLFFARTPHHVKLNNTPFVFIVFFFYLLLISCFTAVASSVNWVAMGREFLLPIAVMGLLKLLKAGLDNVKRFVFGMQMTTVISILIALQSLDSIVIEDESARFGLESWSINSLGFTAATLAVIACSTLLDKSCSRIARPFHLALTLLGAFVALVTKSRTAIIAMAFGLLYILIRSNSKFTKYLLAIVIIGVLWQESEKVLLMLRWEYTIGNSSKDTMFAGRLELWQDALDEIAQNPWCGEGIALSHDPHNWYLATMERTGLIGLFCYLSICITALIKSLRSSTTCYWLNAILYMGILQAFVESRLISYGQFPSTILMISILFFATEARLITNISSTELSSYSMPRTSDQLCGNANG